MIDAPNLAGVTIVHQSGAGRATTFGGTYPLGGMDFTHAPTGRGVITIRAGSGALQLAGGEADEVAPGRWLLQIDRAAFISEGQASGTCELQMRATPPSYVSLRCTVRFGDDPRPITVEWRGDGTAVERIR